MPENETLRINFMAKKQRLIKGLTFGDRQNVIDHLIITGIEHVPYNIDDNIQDTGNAKKVILIDGNEVDNNVDTDEVDNNADVDEVVNDNDNSNEMVNNNSNGDGIANGAIKVIENNEEDEESADQLAPEISVESSANKFI